MVIFDSIINTNGSRTTSGEGSHEKGLSIAKARAQARQEPGTARRNLQYDKSLRIRRD